MELTSDPFPRQEGLNKIPENIYEKIIYKNKLIQTYIDRIDSNREKILNRGILILGNFGTGKTTFFDYLGYYLIRNKICPIRMTFLPKVDVFTYISEFDTKLYSALKIAYCSTNGDYCNGPANLENSKKIMQELARQGWSFMIIIDDLHKHQGYEDVVLRFLASLQIVKDELIRSGIDVGFMIAGIPSWQIKMVRDGSLPGFFDTTPELIPEVSPQDAYQVINSRLAAYSINPRRKSIVDLNWINQIHRKIKNQSISINYRILINEVISELNKKNFGILESNYIDVSEDKLKSIKSILNDYSALDYLYKIVHDQDIKSLDNRMKCFNLIVKLYLDRGIIEDSPEFTSSKFHFKRLLALRITNKLKFEPNFKWVLNLNIIRGFDAVAKELNLFPEDYLKKLFFQNVSSVAGKPKQDKLIEEIDVFLKESESWLNRISYELIKGSLSSLQEYEKVHIEEITKEKFDRNVNLLITSLASISRAIFIMENRMSKPLIDDKELLDSWKDYWFYPTSIANFCNEVWYNTFSASRERLGFTYLQFKESYLDLLAYIREAHILTNTGILIPYVKLKRGEIEDLNNLRKQYKLATDGKSFFEIVQTLNIILEKKIRETLFNHFNIIYGSIKNRLEQLGNLKEYLIRKGVQFDNYSFNEFENLNRGEYKQLILLNSSLRKQYFRYLFKDWDSNQIETFLDIFCDTNIIISHLKTQQINSEDQAFVYRFILNSVELLNMINDMYLDLLKKYFYFFVEKDSIECYFSIPGIKNEDNIDSNKLEDKNKIQNIHELQGIRITLDEINLVYSKIEQYAGKNKKYILNLEDFPLIHNLFSIEYNKFMAILALLDFRTKDKNDNKLRLEILPYSGSEVILSIK